MPGEESFFDEGVSTATQTSYRIPNEELGQHVVRPVTVCQILSATQAHSQAKFKIDGNETANVTIIAHVVDMDTTSSDTANIFYLEDGGSRGRLIGRQWDVDIPGSDEDPAGVGDVMPHSYVRAVGLIAQYEGWKYFRVKHIRRVTDCHEILYHTLQCAYVTLQYQRGLPPSEYAMGLPLNNSGNRHIEDGSNVFLECTDHEHSVLQSQDRRSPSPASSVRDVQDSDVDSSRLGTSPPDPPPDIAAHEDESFTNDDFRISAATGEVLSSVSTAAGEPQGGVEDGKMGTSLDESTSRLQNLSLWDDAEPYTSTPAVRSDATPRRDHASIFGHPSNTSGTLIPRTPTLSPDPYHSLPNLHRAIILKILQAEDENEYDYIGISGYKLAKRIRFHYPSATTQDIDDALDLLVDDGHIYCTVDERHFKVTR